MSIRDRAYTETAKRLIAQYGTKKEKDTTDKRNFLAFRKRVERMMKLINKECGRTYAPNRDLDLPI